MPDEITGSRAGDTAGSVFQRNISKPSIDWSKGGAEHFSGFKESLGEVGKDKSFEPIKDFHGLGKTFVDAQKMIGGSLRLPKEGATPEERKKSVDEIMTKLRGAGIMENIPESPDKYEIKMPVKDIHGDDFVVNDGLLKSFRSAIHKMGIQPSYAQGLFDWYLNFQAEAEAADDAKFEEIKSAMKKEWGGLYSRRMEASRRAIFKYFGEDGDNFISSLPPETGAKIVKVFSQIGDPMLEEALVEGERLNVSTLGDIDKKIMAMFNDPKHPLNDISNPGHKAAVEEYSALQQMKIQLTKK